MQQEAIVTELEAKQKNIPKERIRNKTHVSTTRGNYFAD